MCLPVLWRFLGSHSDANQFGFAWRLSFSHRCKNFDNLAKIKYSLYFI